MTIGKKTSLERRKFLGTLGASAGVAAVAAGSLNAHMPAAAQKIDDKNAAPLKIIDFHNHYMGPSADSDQPRRCAARTKAVLGRGQPQACGPGGADGVDRVGGDRRPRDQHADRLHRGRGWQGSGRCLPAHQRSPRGTGQRNPGRLYGLATVDAYSGDAGARELTRAVRELGLRGVFVESAKNDLLLDAKEARRRSRPPRWAYLYSFIRSPIPRCTNGS